MRGVTADVIGTVAEVWRYPVKSMQGSRVPRLEVGHRGAPDDRCWAVVDPAAGKVLSAKRWPALFEATARRADSGDVVIALPDGTEHVAGDPAADAALSAWLDHEVRLAQPPDGDSLPFDMGSDPIDDTAPSFQWTGPPGTWLDLAAAHVLTTTSLATAAALHPDGAWDVRRFRPTALVEVEPGLAHDGWPEDDWVGKRVRLGSLVIEGLMRTIRCAMPTRAQPGLPRDLDISRVLTEHHGNDLGLYASVAEPGTVAEGDPVSLP
jgi:uncharacterized protein YcbX